MSGIQLERLTFAGFLVSVGIVFGDIGTSPLYTYTAIIGEKTIDERLALGGVSAIFWTLFFQTTLKYVIITLRADNKGEGGIFSLYTLIRRYKKWLLFPAITGGSFLLADSIITPPVSVTSAIEGLKPLVPGLPVMPIVMAIITGLFLIQRAGTSFIGKLFGPVMLVWFSMIGVLGIVSLSGNWSVLKAFNPWYAYDMLVNYPHGFLLLGGVFLCTTGAEALYSDMGHCGRRNIQVSWLYVKICLVFCYFGQAAWLLQHQGETLRQSPFFELVPPWFIVPAIVVATLATIIASQALISGSFTLVAEAIRLNLWPKLRVIYPSDVKGQLYIPAINWILLAGCCFMVWFFEGESKNMEAAFGLSVTLTMLMTTVLLSFYLYVKRVRTVYIFLLLVVFLGIEGAFLGANLIKFVEGGWVTFTLGVLIMLMMYIWYRGTMIKKELQKFTELGPYVPVLRELSNDQTVPKYATNLIYLTSSGSPAVIEERIIQSILYRQPKRADVYWFVHIEVLDVPYHLTYKVDIIEPEEVVWVTFKLGFREAPRLNYLFKKVVEDMVSKKEVSIASRYASLAQHEITGDFRFVVMQRFLSFENELSFINDRILKGYFLLKKLSLPDEKEYGLDYSNVTVEKTPLVVKAPADVPLARE